MTIRFILLVSRQGKVRLTKFYEATQTKERASMIRNVSSMVLSRPQRLCNFLEYKEHKIVYKRCAPPPPPTFPCRRCRRAAPSIYSSTLGLPPLCKDAAAASMADAGSAL